MKKGFTLMEILAVLLVIAVVASFAVPLVKSVRREVRYQRAKAAAVQLAEAVRSFYSDTKGCLPTVDSDDPIDASVVSPSWAGTCPTDHTIKTGVPGSCTGENKKVLFACDYISTKVFSDLSYKFAISDPRGADGTFITGTEQGESKNKEFYVNRDMTITESDD
ncbi:MAG: type II secretion system protein [Elusimicrobiaceae bacterium]|nr:type II secretion system protein [Elusimicrobiaceae bacterium]